MTTYQEMLRDPRWQRRRLEIMQRDNFTCRLCEDKGSTLNVHHCYYENYEDGTPHPPWSYPDDSLLTLCEDCHESQKEELKSGKLVLLNTLGRCGVIAGDYWDLAEVVFELHQHLPNNTRFSPIVALRRLLKTRINAKARTALYKHLRLAQEKQDA